jgi:predicted AlkP superfamily phosphohydrolase/phosphomutase
MKTRVLAIGIDAADSKLIRRLIDDGEMPFLKSLLSNGRWIRLESTADVGSSSVWPTFTTGDDPEVHGIYSEWCWQSESMRLSSLTGSHLNPFWKRLSDKGHSVGVVGVPFAPLIGLDNGFGVSDQPPYVSANNQHKTGPVSQAEAQRALSHGSIKVSAPNDLRNLRKLAADSLLGIKQRGKLAERLIRETKPDVSMVVFTEAHEVSHCLWQTVEPEHKLFEEEALKRIADIRPTLREIFKELDRQLESLVRAAGNDVSVLVFSLHGMTASRGAPTFLTPLMCAAGYSKLAEVKNETWSERAIHSVRAVKKLTPGILKKLYYRSLPRETVLRLAAPTLLPQYDWSQTRAFVIVEEHLSSIRINLQGREAQGSVDARDYETVCRDVEGWLWKLQSANGLPLAKKVIRTATTSGDALNRLLPDIVVHWHDAAFVSPLKVKGSNLAFYRDGERHLSQHTAEGFCILKSYSGVETSTVLPIKQLSSLIESMAAS